MPSKDQLHKTLTLWRGTAIMLNIVLGAGLLVLPGLALKKSGEVAIFTWIICCVAVVPLLTVFTILGRLYPDAGGIPHFAGRAFGRLSYIAASFLLIGAVIFGLPSIALTGGHYASAAFGGNPHVHAVVLLIFAGILNLLSIKMSGLINHVLSCVLLVFLIAIIAIAFFYIPQSSTLVSYAGADISFIYKALLPFHMVIFAFTGWEIAAGLSEEFMNPRRDFPRAMFLSFTIASTLYLFMAYIAQTRDMSAGFESPFATMFGIRFGSPGRIAIAAVAVAIIGINLAAAIWGVSRLIFSLGREGVLPKQVARLTNGQPVVSVCLLSLCLVGVVLAQAAGLISLENLLSFAGQNFFILYGVAAAALLHLTSRWPHRACALFALIVVFGVSIEQETSLIYPLVLVSLAFVAHRLTSHMPQAI